MAIRGLDWHNIVFYERHSMIAAFDLKILMIGGLLLIAWVVIRLLLRPRRALKQYESPLRTSGGTPAHMLDAPADVGRWEVQMHETARNLMGDLNTKIVIVEQLVRDANAAAERLEKAIERADGHG